jgi:hypothetical protein
MLEGKISPDNPRAHDVRALLEGHGAGFEPCGPFADYAPNPNSTFMTLWLEGESSPVLR